ncbi:class I adenylate-forming enzyme family protein [Corynebacterium aquilae]|uniref:class I adenylate-forming enzyme family protein n=1 Tax=Corynebacterium aquilae TaxID=203263 RepID=UPI000952876D|nr:AMP-binding protein [Corynebacterium aquilae]
MMYADIFTTNLPDRAEHPAVTCGDTTLTYGQLHENVVRAAETLLRAGLYPGDVVALWLPNSIDYVVMFHAIAAAGMASVPIPVYATARDVNEAVTATGAKVVIDEQVAAAVIGGDAHALAAAGGTTSLPAGTQVQLPQVAEQAVASMPLSSGTTGTPKVVQLTHANLSANIRQFAEAVPITPEDTVLAPLPLSHIYGLTATMNVPLAIGAHVVVMQFDPKAFLQAFADHDISVLFIAPPVAPLLAGAPESTRFEHLHHIISGAAALSETAGRAVEERTGAKILQGYGMTEASPVTHLSRLDSTPLESIGTPLVDTEHKIIDTITGEDITATGKAGELCVRGPQVMLGYLNNDTATAAALQHGWLHTGDIGQQLADGSIVLSGRIKDIIKSHGVQVSPSKVEQRLIEHPDITDVAVFRGTTSRGEECPLVAYTGQLTPEEVLAHSRQVLTRYECPRAAYAVDAIPRSASGKILRTKLPDVIGATAAA